MNFDPETTVVITCYNYGHYLEGCLRSVFDQTYKDYEIIVVDDGSIDNTPEVMEGFIDLPNVRYIRQENSGQARAKNQGVELAQGQYVAFLDADDRWCPGKLEKQMVYFGKSEIGVVYSRAKFFDEESREFPLEITNPYLLPKRGKVTADLFLDNFVPFSSSVIRKKCLDQFGVFDETLKMGIDWDLWLRISTAYEFDFVDEQLFYYRIGHSGQMSKNVETRQQCSDRIMERFIRNYPDALSPKIIREANYLTCCNRGEHFRHSDKRKSYLFFAKAIRTTPFRKDAYKGIIKNLIGYSPLL